MKTTKIITTLATLNLILFMSVTTIANPSTMQANDGEKSSVKKQLSAVNIDAVSSTLGNEFSHLRFDVYDFINADNAETTEMPLTSELEYLRFDVSNFTTDNSAELIEMPANEFDYLRFDVSKFENENTITMDELPSR
jgi:hypothetical protein